MAVGQGAIINALSYLALGRESTFKTYDTATAGLDFMSASFKTMREDKVLEQIETSRTYSQSIKMMKKIEGEFEYYPTVAQTAVAYILQNGFGGTVTSATATGETAGGLAFTHTFSIGNFDNSYTSLCVNHRKGGSSTAYTYQYNGIRVNELGFSAEIDDALKGTVGLSIVDSTQSANDVSAAIGHQAQDGPLSFVNGRISVSDSLGSLSSGAYWHVQSFEFGIANSIKADAGSGRIGSAVLDVLPPGIATFNFTVNMRFDTLTAYDGMLNNTRFAAEFEFTGNTIGTSVINEAIKFQMPNLKISAAGDPEVGGPDEFLTSEVTFTVLRDNSSASGYAVQALLTNAIASY